MTEILNQTVNPLPSARMPASERNHSKPRANLARISKYLHILIFEFLTPKEIFKVCLVSRSLHKAS